jgi:hypothetical protein
MLRPSSIVGRLKKSSSVLVALMKLKLVSDVLSRPSTGSLVEDKQKKDDNELHGSSHFSRVCWPKIPNDKSEMTKVPIK